MKRLKRLFFCAVMAVTLGISQSGGQNILEAEELALLKTYTDLQQALAHPDSVYKLTLKGKKLTEIPPEVFTLHNLQVLNLSKNRITVIPPGIANLKNLQELDLSNNRLTNLPPQIGELRYLNKLKLNKNVITALPPEMGSLINLEVLEMWNNELDTVPDDMRFLVRLKTFELRGILFSEEEQEEIQSLLPNTKIYFSPSCACKN